MFQSTFYFIIIQIIELGEVKCKYRKQAVFEQGFYCLIFIRSIAQMWQLRIAKKRFLV